MRGKVKRGIALLLSLAMAFSLLSVAAWATGSEERETEENLRAAWDAQQSESAGKEEVQTQQDSNAAEGDQSNTTGTTESDDSDKVAEEWGLDLPVYKADIISDVSIQSSIDVQRPAEKLVSMLQDDTKFMASVAAWKTATFNAGDTADNALKEVDYYEVTLMNMLNTATSDDGNVAEMVVDASQKGLGITKDILAIAEKFKEVDVLGPWTFENGANWLKSKTMRSVSPDTVQAIKEYLKEREGVYAIAENTSYVSDIIDSAKDLYDLMKKFAAYVELLSTSDNMIAVLEELYKQCPAENLAMKTAILNVKENCKASALSAITKTMQTGAVVARAFFRMGVGQLWTDMIAATGPFAFGAMVGQAIGKTISNIMFSTDKTIEFYYQMNAYTELMDLTRKTYSSVKETYLANRNTANAGNYLEALKLMYNGFITGSDYASDFADIVYNQGLWNKITQANKSKDYLNFVNSCDNIKSDTKDAYTILTNNLWQNALQDEYPELYKLLFRQNAIEEPEEQEPVVPVTGVRFTTDAQTIGLESKEHGWADYEVLPENATNKSVTVTSSDPETVEVQGFLCALIPKKLGTVTLTATTEDGGFTATQTVTVVEGGDVAEEDVLLDSGTCGENLIWGLTRDGTLYIRGSGEMTDWKYSSDVPWYSNRSKIRKVKIGRGVTNVGKYAFTDCDSLTSVTIGNSVTSIGEHAFYNCSSLTSVTIPDSVTSIAEDAFRGCSKLTSITIPDSVTSIGEEAFSNCSKLTSMTIPSSVTSIGGGVFVGCNSLARIDVEENNKQYCSINGVLFNKDKTKIVCYPEGKTDSTYTIPDGVTNIGENAFYGCSSLTSVTIPDSACGIGKSAFAECTKLVSIKIPSNVNSVMAYAFSGCTNLKNVYITDIDAWCIINFSTDSSNPLRYANNLYLNDVLVTDVVIPNGVITIDPYLLSCSSLKSVVIPNSVRWIKEGAFLGCSNLTSVEIPKNVRGIESGAFYNCSSLTNITIPGENLQWIDARMFWGCSSLNRVTILSGVGCIDDWGFARCNSLTSITIPKSMKSIHIGAFNGCSSLADIYYEGSESDWEQISIDMYNTEFRKATIHYNSTDPTDPTEKVISNCTINLEKTSYTYDGKAKQPTVTVKDGSTTLTSGKDYDVTYADNTDAGTAKVTITGKGDYTGSVTKEFTIQKAKQTISASISPSNIQVGETAQITASAKTNVSYSSSDAKVAAVSASGVVTGKAVGTATITVTAKASKNYNEASKNVIVTVTEKSVPVTKKLSACKVTLAATSYTYDGKEKKPAVTVKDGSTTLTNGKDYEVAYANNINAGTARVTITGKGNYTGTVTMNVIIKKAASVITASNITKATSAKAQKASIGAKVKGGAKLTYKSNNKYVTVDKKGQVTIAKKFVGQATITITAAATKNYNAGTKKVTVTVNPASTKLSSVKNSASKSMKVAWKKNAAVTGYQVQYSTYSNFKGAKAVTVKKAATTSTTVKKLVKGKKYYVRVRTYKKVGNKNYYSAWSASKNVTIKK